MGHPYNRYNTQLQSPPTLQGAAPALREGVIWSVGQVKGDRRGTKGSGWVNVGVFFSSSAWPRSSGIHTGRPLELCISERPEGEIRRKRLNMIFYLFKRKLLQSYRQQL